MQTTQAFDSTSANPRPPAAVADPPLPKPPFGLSFHTRALSSGRIAYLDEGSGPAILLLHGAPMTALGFVRVVRELRTRYRVIVPDQPGFGRSTASERFDGSLASYAGFVEEFCRELRLERFFVYLNDSSACIGLVGLAAHSRSLAGLIVADTVPVPLTGRFALVRWVLKHLIASRPFRWLNRRFNLLPWVVARVAPLATPSPLPSAPRCWPSSTPPRSATG